MSIEIHSYLSASFKLSNQPDIADAIVVLDSRSKHTDFVSKNTCRHLYLRFDDIVSESINQRIATTEDVSDAIEFAAGSKDLIVCCRAGQSRSAALAVVVAASRSLASEMLDSLNPKRHVPNARIIELGARILSSPELLVSFDRWRAMNRGIVPSDFVDDISLEIDSLEARGATDLISISR